MKPIPSPIDPPAWIDNAYMSKALQHGLNCPELEVISMQITAATNVGDNYMSQMLRVKLEMKRSLSDEKEIFSVVLKTLPIGITNKKQILEIISERARKEAGVLMNILPQVQKILSDVVPEQDHFGPKCFYYGICPEPVIAMEDLKEKGFENAKGMNGLDKSTCMAVLNELAKYHAGSMALFKKEPELALAWGEQPVTEERTAALWPIYDRILTGLIEEVTSWDLSDEIICKLNKLKETGCSKFFECYDFDKNAVNTLLHGDCWINNLMFSKTDSNNIRLRFVDFQRSTFNSIVLDLHFFLFSSPEVSIRISALDEMLLFYFNSFTSTLKLLNVDLPSDFTFSTMMADFKKRIFYGLHSLLIVYPIAACPSEKAPKLNQFHDNSSKRVFYQTEKFREAFNVCLPYFLESGAL